ncbi:MAG: trehalase family glycosidase, partial [Gemmatimonadaceae bacterium]
MTPPGSPVRCWAPRWSTGVAFFAAACLASAPPTPSPAPGVSGGAARYDPAHDLGPLFHDVQLARVFADSKTLVDARPRQAPREVASLYETARGVPGFVLSTFVAEHFELPPTPGGEARADSSRSMEEHVRALWPSLTRAADAPDARSSLIPLPKPYVVPGGRFREVYYWDSYFTMLGLVQSGRTDLVANMLDNFAHLIVTVGHVPNGNRTYYLSRSQPPYFAAMVGLYAQAVDTAQALRYLDAMEREHAFWMEGAERLRPASAHRRVVTMPDGAVLNRYWDDRAEPRPESYREDYTLAQRLPEAQREAFYRSVRASAESGWDFSSRWMRDTTSLLSLETTALVPVDLNSLLYHQERTIAAFRSYRARSGGAMTDDSTVAARYAAAAAARRRTLLAYSFDAERGFFFDVRWR